MAVKSQSQNRQLFIVCQNGEDGKQVKYKIFLKKKKKKITVAGIDYSELWSFYSRYSVSSPPSRTYRKFPDGHDWNMNSSSSIQA